MRKAISFAVMALFVTVAAVSAADQTWTGQISDSMCGAKHMTGEHGQKLTDRECTQACIKTGEKYVFVSEGKVYKIGNQDKVDLVTHAGHTVLLTGELKGDTITVSKIAMPGTAKKGGSNTQR